MVSGLEGSHHRANVAHISQSMPDSGLGFQEKVIAHSSSHAKCFSGRFQKSIPAKIRQHILYISCNERYVDGFVGELTSA